MNTVKILVEGNAKENQNNWVASSTVTLIKADGKNIIVDPGCNREKLLKSLKNNNLKTGDIDFVFITHNHTDHILLAGVFENAKIIDNSEIYDDDKITEHKNIIPGTNLKIIQTPGHDQFHCSLVVDTSDGIYIIAGDVFWWMNEKRQKLECNDLVHHPDPYAKDLKVLQNSRKKILKLANFVIPGHGKLFKVEYHAPFAKSLSGVVLCQKSGTSD